MKGSCDNSTANTASDQPQHFRRNTVFKAWPVTGVDPHIPLIELSFRCSLFICSLVFFQARCGTKGWGAVGYDLDASAALNSLS